DAAARDREVAAGVDGALHVGAGDAQQASRRPRPHVARDPAAVDVDVVGADPPADRRAPLACEGLIGPDVAADRVGGDRDVSPGDAAVDVRAAVEGDIAVHPEASVHGAAAAPDEVARLDHELDSAGGTTVAVDVAL